MKINKKFIKQVFYYWVAKHQDKEYHSKDCLEAQKKFEELLDKHVIDPAACNEISLAAMDMVNKYGMCDFIVGFKQAMNMFDFKKR